MNVFSRKTVVVKFSYKCNVPVVDKFGNEVSKGSFSFQVLTILVSRGRHPFDHDSSCVDVAHQRKGELCEQEFFFY